MSKQMNVHKNGNFTVISNTFLKDRLLSYKAKGLLALMVSLPENWDYTLVGLSKLASDGLDSTRSGINELIKYRYVIRTRVQAGNGQIIDWKYDIYEEPQTAHPKPSQPDLGFPHVDNPHVENPTQLNTKELRTNKYNYANRKWSEKSGSKKVGFKDNFHQREYDFDELERQLLAAQD